VQLCSLGGISVVLPLYWLLLDLMFHISGLDWIEQCFTSPLTQYRLYERRFLQVRRPKQQYQSTEGTYNTQITEKHNNRTHALTKNTANPLVYNNMGWLGDGSHRRQVRHAWMAVGLPPRNPLHISGLCYIFNACFISLQFTDYSKWYRKGGSKNRNPRNPPKFMKSSVY